jgi:sugar phosphate isomerase/epimerase
MYSRREFGKLALASLPLSAALANGKPNSMIHGVWIGAQSYSFRTLPSVDDAIKAMASIGLSECELWQGHVEPPAGDRSGKEAREALRKFRLDTPLAHFKGIADKFKTAGITLYAYNYSFRDDFTDEEIARGFDIAKALGVKCITASATVSVTKRVAPVAEKHKMVVGMHGHDNLKDPNQFAKPESFEKAMSESKWIGVNLDVGHFTAAGYDPIEFLQKYHERIVTLHIKDRKKNQGANMPFGEGETDIKAVLQLLKARKWKIPANIEYEYKGASDPEAEVRKCYEYCKQALA